MKRHALQSIAIALALVAGRVFALETAKLLTDADARALLEKKCIRTEAYGMLPARFDAAASYLNQPGLVQRIQGEYRCSVSRDGTIDFPIVGTGNGEYHYVNEKNQRTDLFELCRRQTSDSTFDLIYLAKGKRYFGKYEVLIHIRVVDAQTAGILYIAEIHAYPRNAALRFFARRFGTIERYFQRKTRLIDRVSNKICIGMEDSPTFVYQPSDPTVGP